LTGAAARSSLPLTAQSRCSVGGRRARSPVSEAVLPTVKRLLVSLPGKCWKPAAEWIWKVAKSGNKVAKLAKVRLD